MLWLESERKYHNEHILSHPYFSGCPLSHQSVIVSVHSLAHNVILPLSIPVRPSLNLCFATQMLSSANLTNRISWKRLVWNGCSWHGPAQTNTHVWNGCLPIWRSPMLPVLLVSLYPNMWLALLLHCIDHFQFIHIIRQLTLGFHLTIVARFTKKQSWFSAPETSVLPLPTV